MPLQDVTSHTNNSGRSICHHKREFHHDEVFEQEQKAREHWQKRGGENEVSSERRFVVLIPVVGTIF